MFRVKRWRGRQERPEQIADKVLLCENEVELNFDQPTYDDLAELFEDLDNKIQIEEERAENRVDYTKMHKPSFVQKIDWFKRK